jgi:hypothetical protein
VYVVRESRWLREIRTLDPERDCRRIVFLDTFYEFPFDTTRALELAFFKTFASPSIAALLESTGEFTQRGQKRYDDTDLLISSFAEDGWAGERGKSALRRMNQIHRRFAIPNDDYLYVLSAMVLEPLRWNRRFGWRPLLEVERLAAFHFWREIGGRMAIEQIPASLEKLECFNLEYERSRFAATPAGRALAHAQRDVFLSWFAWLPRPLGASAISSILDDQVVDLLGLVKPSSVERRAAERALRLRARLVRALPPRRRPRLRTTMRRRSYPAGYAIERLGPPPETDRRRRENICSCPARRRSCTPTSTRSSRRWSSATILVCAVSR